MPFSPRHGVAGAATALAGEKHLYPAKDVPAAATRSDRRLTVTESETHWSFDPADGGTTGMLFFPGGGVDPVAYAPLARRVTEAGCPVRVVKLGLPLSPTAHRRAAVAIGLKIMTADAGVKRWVVAGHSMGASVAARFAHDHPKRCHGLVLLGTTHPRDFDLSGATCPVVKVSASEDRVASVAKSEANCKLLPAATNWVTIDGGNHAQFGDYGPQFGDGKATITRDAQQQCAAEILTAALRQADSAG